MEKFMTALSGEIDLKMQINSRFHLGEHYEDRNNIFNQAKYMDVSYITNNKMLFRTRKSLF